LRHRDLTAHRLATRFKIHGVGEALFRLCAPDTRECEPFGGRARPLIDAGHFTFADNALARFAVGLW
jgi:hypothetical protein